MSSAMIMGIVTAIVCLFIGLFAINMTSNIQSKSDLYDYSYNDSSDTTSRNVVVATNATKTWYVPTIPNIVGETGKLEFICINVTNTNATAPYTASAYLNNTYGETLLETKVMSASTNNLTCYDVTLAPTRNNQIIVVCNAISNTCLETKIRVKMATATSATGFGSIYDNLVSNTSTVYDVLFLAIIIVALAIGIAYLKGMTGSAETATF